MVADQTWLRQDQQAHSCPSLTAACASLGLASPWLDHGEGRVSSVSGWGTWPGGQVREAGSPRAD